MGIIEEVPLFPQEKIKEEKALKDWSDIIFEVSVPLFGDIDDGRSTIREATIKTGKYYIDAAKAVPRIEVKSTNKEAVIYLKSNEKRLSEILDCIPYGLINKQLTGIGATYLEMHSSRNSIIVTPTRTLAYNKSLKEPDKYLYVGTKLNGKTTSDKEIQDYLDRNIKPKKILVVADSLYKVIRTITNTGIDIYREYFLMVDEIDTLQSDNHFRPQLSNVVDYYFKFRQDNRALVSATIKGFSHPKLIEEPYITITCQSPLRRKINLLHTNNINQLLSDEIKRITKKYPNGKILIAYNSVQNALKTINLLLPELPRENFGILCSDASTDEVGNYKSVIENDRLTHKINFMTCAFFAGIDIEDKCHLIAVSNVSKGYSLLSINKMTQIYGRCRNGIISDTIIYNSNKKSFRYINNYKDKLKYKAQKVIDLLESADKLKEGDNDLTDLFSRIEKVIIEKADERFFFDTPIKLIRKNIDKKREISYFNIDALYEQMEVYSSLYSTKDALKEQLIKANHEVIFNEISFDVEELQTNEYDSRDIILNKVQLCKDKVLEMKRNNTLTDDLLNYEIRHTKRKEADYYKRIKAHYQYIDINYLADKLYDISLENKKSYRGVKNALSFWILDDNHSFKMQISEAFKDHSKKYSSQEIAEILKPIIKYHFFKTLNQSRLVGLFKIFFDWTYTQGKYLIKGTNPLAVPEPIKKISAKEEILYNYFEI
ncbi:hypothetical protein CLV62_10318 [Dysgonomonas alginatilytica]|uniref:DEAD/DEAH-box helicase domain-containing protein n=1 Tax=Dysgonomonas alginatilytica TaxID=1605892 RepID=A0A2V3PRX8_9BACT|nr:DEAD/DEAH box helicase family protein [Dysgonomonas alginatilytica]PXV67345.1 hypothetical protein CLV62_10318 [Dysgonomonas alginatilytica]